MNEAAIVDESHYRASGLSASCAYCAGVASMKSTMSLAICAP